MDAALSPELFSKLKQGRISDCVATPLPAEDQLQTFLPLLLRTSLFGNEDARGQRQLETLLTVALECKRSNRLLDLFKLDFETLCDDLNKEAQLRRKQMVSDDLLSIIGTDSFTKFEEATEVTTKLRLVVGEVLLTELLLQNSSQGKVVQRKCEIFDNDAFLFDVSELLIVACFEMPSLVNVCQVSEVLVHFNGGPYLVQRLIINFPDSIYKVSDALINGSIRPPLSAFDDAQNRRRVKAVLLLCELDASLICSVMNLCTTALKLPALFLELCAFYLSTEEFVSVLHGIYFSSSSSSLKAWLAEAFTAPPTLCRTNKAALAESAVAQPMLQSRLRSAIDEISSKAIICERSAALASDLLRLYCVLKLNHAVKFTDEECQALINLISLPFEPSTAVNEFICTGLAALFAMPTLIVSLDLEKRVRAWLKSLNDLEMHFSELVEQRYGNSFSEMLLLIAIHLHSAATTLLSQLVSAQLKVKVTLRINSLAKLKNYILQDLLPEEVLVAKKVPVTQNLNSACTGYLSIHCIHYLLRNKVFSRHKITITDWILQQVKCCSLPVHTEVPLLLDTFASCCVPSPNNPVAVAACAQRVSNTAGVSSSHASFSEKDIMDIFVGNIFDVSKIVPRVLLLYFALAFEEILTQKNTGHANARECCYSRTFWDSMPVRFLTDFVQSRAHEFSCVAPNLLRLATIKFPYLYVVLSAWPKFRMSDVRSGQLDRSLPFTPEALQQALNASTLGGCPAKALTYLENLRRIGLDLLLAYTEVVCGSTGMLLDCTDRQILDSFFDVWLRLEGIHPRKAYWLTLRSLVPSVTHMKPVSSLEDFDPLIVLRVDQKVFRCGPILQMLLRILSCYLLASRVHLQRLASVQQTSGAVDSEREELTQALVCAQESTAIQILLEACLPTSSVSSFSPMGNVSELRECRCLIFSYLHQCFIADPLLMKLIHFQGYADELLPLTAGGIPSMHICLDFISELLTQPDCSKYVFAINLLSHLCVQYPIPKAFFCARLAVNFLSSLVPVLPQAHLAQFCTLVFFGYRRMSQIFPMLTKDITSCFNQLMHKCYGELQPVESYCIESMLLHVENGLG